MFDIPKELKNLPGLPGVYIMKDENGNALYIGKSKCLKNRVRSYFQPSNAEYPKNKAMVPLIRSFEYIVTDNEIEALVLECNLIKKHRPPHNVLLKDNKTYPYLKLTVNEDYPRIFITRSIEKDNAKYYGPYPAGFAVNEVLDLIRQLWHLRMCSKPMHCNSKNQKNTRPCLNYHMGGCKAPCSGLILKSEYDKIVSGLLDFLNGKRSGVLKSLELKMEEAAENLEFEKAAVLRNQIFAVKKFDSPQKLEKVSNENKDIVAFARSGNEAMAQLFFIREGKMVGREHHLIMCSPEMPDSEIMYAFVMQFYSGNPDMPHELILQINIENAEEISDILSKQRGSKVLITAPQKGEKAKLVALARHNAVISLERHGGLENRELSKTIGALKEIAGFIGFDGITLTRVEAYDISNTQGFESVGSMVVYENGKPKRKDYRKFKIKTVDGSDDYASMQEVLTRRFNRYLKEQGGNGENKFIDLPDILFIDGGKGQVSAAEAIVKQFGLEIPVCGMVKDNKHKTRGLMYGDKEIILPKQSEGFKLLTRIQDEVHRFAIEYHRKLREKKMVLSELDNITGIGDIRKKALLKHFGSIDEIKRATVDGLCAVEKINKPSAQAIYDFFNQEETSPEISENR